MRKVSTRRAIPKCIKIKLWDMRFGLDKGKVLCPVCNERYIYQIDHEVGHIRAVSKGGTDHIHNLLPICHTCNNSMGSMHLYKFAKKWYGRILRFRFN